MAELIVVATPVFLAAVVECVEAWTIVLAVGLTRGWRAPLVGVAVALVVIGSLVAVFGATLVDRIDEELFEFVIGSLLVLFGVRWMRKAVLRYVGAIPLHDEQIAFRRQVDALEADAVAGTRFDWAGFTIALQAMLVEGLEIVFLVITLGSADDTSYTVAAVGAAAAFVTVGVAGFVGRKPLSRVPENTLKAFVSVMLATFGTYWVATGLGVEWVGGSWALLYLFAAWSIVVVATVRVFRPDPARATEAAV